MTQPSPRNPNICPGCEQLLEDDCAALEQLMAEPGPAVAMRLNTPVEDRAVLEVSL